MARAYSSTVVDQTSDSVWAVVRDFNNYPSYIDGVDQSIVEDGKPGDSVGAVRRFRYGGEWVRQRLVALSDADKTFTYAGLEPFLFPILDENEDLAPPSAIEYEGTLAITPVTDGNRSFIEWWVTFDCGRDERHRWTEFLEEAISQWVGSLKAHIAKQ